MVIVRSSTGLHLRTHAVSHAKTCTSCTRHAYTSTVSVHTVPSPHPHAGTDPHIDDHTYITASHPTHVAFRISARTTNAPPEAPREEQQRGCNRCRRARPAMPPCICPPQRHASPASPQPRWNRLVAAGGGPCACIPSWDVRDASLRCSTCWESTERSHGTQRCEGEKGMRRHEEVQERTGRGLWARPGAKLTAASRRSCWTNLSKRNLRYEIRWGA